MSWYCVICGADIGNQHYYASDTTLHWKSEYRVVYSTPQGTQVSGVGSSRDSRAIVPINENGRYDSGTCQLVQIPVMREQPKSDGWHGFVFHDACWSLLKECHQGEPLPLEQFLDVLLSLDSVPGYDIYYWEHCYRDLLSPLNSYRPSPWNYPPMVHSNPYNISGAEKLLNDNPKLPPPIDDMPTHDKDRKCRNDCFLGLPFELIGEIATHLPTKDVLRLRQVSRPFIHLFYSQAFWASRFRANGERGYLFDVWKNPQARDWRSLYHSTKNASLCSALQNRKRVWSLTQSIMETLTLQWSGLSSLQPVPEMPGYGWMVAQRGSKPEQRINRSYGRLPYHEQKTSLPRLSRFDVFIIHDGPLAYIAGIYMTAEDGTDMHLGYASSTRIGTDVTCTAQGFALAIGSKGIHAIQLAMEDKSLSPWLGCEDQAIRTKFLTGWDPIAALAVGFDGYKLVYFSVYTRKTNNIRPKNPFRNSSHWYPCPPKGDVYLSKPSSFGAPRSNDCRNAIRWVDFKGSSGASLQSLTGMCVVYDPKQLIGIESYHNRSRVPSESHKLGQCERTKDMRAINFGINGPRGERIQRIEIPVSGDRVCDFKVWTNRGRSCLFEGKKSRAERAMKGTERQWKDIDIKPGTVIMGLYTRLSSDGVFMGIGVMSETDKTGG